MIGINLLVGFMNILQDLTNVNDGIIINNLFVPSVNTSNYGLKQLNGTWS